MRTIYLVRHGKVEFPQGGTRCIGRTDVTLSEAGRCQARDLALYFRDKPVEAVYASPLSRALETASLLAAGRIPVRVETDLLELDMGEWENVPLSCIKKTLESEPVFGEGRIRGLERFLGAVERILAQTAGDLVIVAHAGINCCFLAHILGSPLETSRALIQPYGGISKIQIADHGGMRVETLGIKPFYSPCDRECREIWEHYQTPEPVRRHCLAVTGKAVALASALRLAGCPLDLGIVRSAAMLHDVARRRPEHALAGARILMKEGYPLVANVIRQHHDLDVEQMDEAAVVFLADKWIQGEREVSLEERFGKSLEKCLGNSEAMAAHGRRYRQALTVEEMAGRLLPRTAAQ